MRLLNNRESGQALIMVLILLAVGGLMVTPTLNLASTSLRYHQVVEKNVLETYAADSGVQYALYKLGNNPVGFGAEPLLSEVNNKNVNVSVQDMGSNIFKITSTATTQGVSSTTIESYVQLTGGLFANALTVINGDLSLEGSTVLGDVYANGTVSTQDSTVTGTITEYGTLEFNMLDTDPYRTEAQNGGIITGNLILGTGTHNLGPTYITGYLKIQEGAEVTLGGTVYAEGQEKMDGTITIRIEAGSIITGAGNFIAEQGDIKLEVSRLELDNIPLIAAISGNIICESNEYIRGILYAPEVTFLIGLEENMQIYGSVFAANLGTLENTTIIYPSEEESDLLGSIVPNILTWQVSK